MSLVFDVAQKDSFRFDDFKLVAGQRKKLAAMIKSLQPKVSNRQIAKALGVDKNTITSDLGENSPRGSKKLNKNNAAGGENSPPTIAGRAAVRKRRS